MPAPDDLLDPADRDPRRHLLLRAWLLFQATLGLQPERAAKLLRRTGNPAAALRASGETPRLDERDLRACLDALRRSGASSLPLPSRLYPERLARLADPPPLLHVAGEPRWLLARSVAIVGSRAATARGLRTARRFAGDLAAAGVTIVSGLARGIDGAAHRGALEGGGATVAVQACGPEQVYPREHRSLAREITRDGALVSELLPGTPPISYLFPLRNRLISGLAEIVIVFEARERSGSLVTARHALDQGVDVMVVPGPIDEPASFGNNRLLRDGAPPALDAADVLAALRWPVDAMQRSARAPSSATPRDPLAAAILDALAHEPAGSDDLARRLGRRPEELAEAVVTLELDGAVVRERDGRLHRAPPPRRSP